MPESSQPIALDRMTIEEAGPHPEKLAAAIHKQLRLTGGPVPVHGIARALDISEIREKLLVNFEGALLMMADRSHGAVLLNSNSSRERRRFSLSHELGHFLIATHKPQQDSGFRCKATDMHVAAGRGLNRYQQQEAEANRFAIELLAPPALAEKFTRRAPDLSAAVEMATGLYISREAAARRYIELHQENLAIVFSKDGLVSYYSLGRGFPAIMLRRNERLPLILQDLTPGRLTGFDAVDPEDWLRRPQRRKLAAQTFAQQDGYAMTLLHVEDAENDDEQDEFDRFRRK